MQIQVVKSKIHRVKVTGADLIILVVLLSTRLCLKHRTLSKVKKYLL